MSQKKSAEKKENLESIDVKSESGQSTSRWQTSKIEQVGIIYKIENTKYKIENKN